MGTHISYSRNSSFFIFLRYIFAIVVVFSATSRGLAQWVSEDYPLKAGWNAIWLSLDVSHGSIDDLLSGETAIEEVWYWNTTASSTQFTQSPATPVQSDNQWLIWKRGKPTESTISNFVANGTYLIKVADTSPDITLNLTGKPTPPNYSWSSSGLNFFGFPMQTPDSVTDRNFERFLSFSNTLSTAADIFFYDGGALESNPVRVTAPRLKAVSRGQAYWIQSSQFTDFYGPLRVTTGNAGLNFRDTGAVTTLKIKNLTNSQVTATVTPAVSAVPPTGEDANAGPVPLQIRGELDPTTGNFEFEDFDSAETFDLEAGEEVEIVIAVDRSTMTGNPDDVFQSILQVTDSEKISRVDLPVRAVKTSLSGLWVGTAIVNQVDQITAAPAPVGDGTATVDVTTDADADAPSAFPLRIILHRSDNGTVNLQQQVYIGENTSGNTIIAAEESELDPEKLANARRLSSASFPLDEKVVATGDLGLTGEVTLSSVLAHDAQTNPFVHTYHPDHDNKDLQFSTTPLLAGDESYTVNRDIKLIWEADPDELGISDLNWGSTILGGDYEETITGLRAQPIKVKGTFILYRVSDIATLIE